MTDSDRESLIDFGIDVKREGSIMCRFCQRQIQRCICDGPNDTPIDIGPNGPAKSVPWNAE